MSWTQDGANIATMIGSLSVITALIVWAARSCQRWIRRREEARQRNWHGSIEVGGIDTWYVRLIEHPTEPTARVVLEVLDAAGKPTETGGHHMRQRASADGRLSRSPTTGELEFLRHLRAERGYAKSPIVR